MYYGNSLANGEYLFIDTNEIRIGIDILGSSFFMLIRYEEYVKKERDNLALFSAKDSLAYQEFFLERPIINEYIELLWWCINKLWPELKRKKENINLFLRMMLIDQVHYWGLGIDYSCKGLQEIFFIAKIGLLS